MNPIVRRNHLTYIKSGRGASWRHPEADVFPRPAPRRWLFFFLCVFFVFANIQQIGIDGFIPPQLQLIVCPRNHHHPQGGPEAPNSSEHADPRRVLHRWQHKPGKRGGLHGCRLENNLDKLRARITTQREIRACCSLIFTETQSQSALFSYRPIPYEETRLQPRPKGEVCVCLSTTCGVEIYGLFMIGCRLHSPHEHGSAQQTT